MHAGLGSCHRAPRLRRRAAASARAPCPPGPRRCPEAARPSSAPPWPRRSPAAGWRVHGVGTPAAASGKGQSFLLLAGEPVVGQPARPLRLKGAALGEPRVVAGGARAGRGRPLGAALPGEHLMWGGRAAPGRVPEPRWPHPKTPASRPGRSSPASTPGAPPPSFLFSFTGSPRPPSPSVGLAAARRLGHPPPAAHSLQHREPGPAPGEGAAGKLQPAPSTQLPDLREPARGLKSPGCAPLREGANKCL